MPESHRTTTAHAPRVTFDTLVGAGIAAPLDQRTPRRFLYPEFARWTFALFAPEEMNIVLSSAATHRLHWLLRHPVQYEAGLASRRRGAEELVAWIEGGDKRIEQCSSIARSLRLLESSLQSNASLRRWIRKNQHRVHPSDGEEVGESESRARTKYFLKQYIFWSHGTSNDTKISDTFIEALTNLCNLESLLTSSSPPSSYKLLHSLDLLRRLSRTPLHPEESGHFVRCLNFSNRGILADSTPEIRWDTSIASSLREMCVEGAPSPDIDAYVACRCAILALMLSAQGRLPTELGEAKNLIESVGNLSGEEVVTLLTSPKPCRKVGD